MDFPMTRISDEIRKSAEHAAENDLGPKANMYPEESPQFDQWNSVYYARVQMIAVEMCS